MTAFTSSKKLGREKVKLRREKIKLTYFHNASTPRCGIHLTHYMLALCPKKNLDKFCYLKLTHTHIYTTYCHKLSTGECIQHVYLTFISLFFYKFPFCFLFAALFPRISPTFSRYLFCQGSGARLKKRHPHNDTLCMHRDASLTSTASKRYYSSTRRSTCHHHNSTIRR